MPIGLKVVGGFGNATDEDVLEGVTYTSDDGIKRTGTSKGVELDDTLSVQGMAADAKAVGDKFEDKLDKNLGTENTNKYLKVDETGNVIPSELDIPEVPTKLSEFENDLYGETKREILSLTQDDFVYMKDAPFQPFYLFETNNFFLDSEQSYILKYKNDNELITITEKNNDSPFNPIHPAAGVVVFEYRGNLVKYRQVGEQLGDALSYKYFEVFIDLPEGTQFEFHMYIKKGIKQIPSEYVENGIEHIGNGLFTDTDATDISGLETGVYLANGKFKVVKNDDVVYFDIKNTLLTVSNNISVQGWNGVYYTYNNTKNKEVVFWNNYKDSTTIWHKTCVSLETSPDVLYKSGLVNTLLLLTPVNTKVAPNDVMPMFFDQNFLKLNLCVTETPIVLKQLEEDKVVIHCLEKNVELIYSINKETQTSTFVSAKHYLETYSLSDDYVPTQPKSVVTKDYVDEKDINIRRRYASYNYGEMVMYDSNSYSIVDVNSFNDIPQNVYFEYKGSMVTQEEINNALDNDNCVVVISGMKLHAHSFYRMDWNPDTNSMVEVFAGMEITTGDLPSHSFLNDDVLYCGRISLDIDTSTPNGFTVSSIAISSYDLSGLKISD